MPYKKLQPMKPVIDSSFVDEIANELRLEQAEGSADAPIIAEEEARYSGRTHVTVI